jgi:hypothetical protein
MTLVQRMIGAAKLDARVYEEVEVDERAFRQSLLVVMLSSMATAVGISGRVGIAGLLTGLGGGLLGWFLWAGLTFLIGTRLLPVRETEANLGQLLRTTGFATAPAILAVLGLAPALTGFISFITDVWVLAAFVVAVRQALDYRSTWRALAVCAIGWLIYVAIIWALLSGPR